MVARLSVCGLTLLVVASLGTGGVAHAYELTLTIVYDNYQHADDVTPDWGFGCFIEGGDNTILFDTGWHGEILLQNCTTLDVDLDLINTIVISHNHLDHTGGSLWIDPE